MSAMTLLPCPFCGGNAKFEPYKRDGLTLKCESLGCVKFSQRTLRQSIEWLQGKMADSWNTRLRLTQPAQSVDVRNVVLKSLGGYLERHWPDNPVSYDDMANKLTAALQEKAG